MYFTRPSQGLKFIGNLINLLNIIKCVVKAYLKWLQDSEFEDNCGICKKTFDNNYSNIIRLTCLGII